LNGEESPAAATGAGKLNVLLSHPTGNQNVRNALQSFAEHDMLAEFWTAIAWNPASRWSGVVPARLRSQLEKRAFPEAPGGKVHCAPSREVVRLAARGSFLHHLLCSRERPFSVIGMYRHFDNKVARRVESADLDAVYAYEGGARKTFRAAKRRGVSTFYEQPSSYWYWTRNLLLEEAERNPEYAGLLPTLADSNAHLEWKDEELALADFVFVASEHVRRTLKGAVPDERIRVVRYGAPPVRLRRPRPPQPGRSLRVLFVGLLAQNKGIGYLLDAIDKLGSGVELTLVGNRFRPHSRVDEACNRWRWLENLPHSDVLELMMESDVLVLPSLADAFGLVITEALACGLPVVVTRNAGASDLIEDGREGFVVPICSAAAIADRLEKLIGDRPLLEEMSCNAQRTAAANSWESYRAALAETVRVALCR